MSFAVSVKERDGQDVVAVDWRVLSCLPKIGCDQMGRLKSKMCVCDTLTLANDWHAHSP